MIITDILNWLRFWRNSKPEHVYVELPPSQIEILAVLDIHAHMEDVHYDDLMSPKELYNKLSERSIGSWREFYDDLAELEIRRCITHQDNKILILPRGSYLVRQYKKTYND